ncbi:MAG TPA: hypothetical protein VJ901_07320 [Thermoanaerobaculia bacterium]|nr:hypothetical protein [Thermoanaerobaculia bacterium]
MSVTMTSSASERYIIPVWGQFVQGASATYTGTIVTTNVGDTPATVTVKKIIPILEQPCVGSCTLLQWTLSGRSTQVISDQGPAIYGDGHALALGAVEIESDQPIEVASEIFSQDANNAIGWQSVEVGRDWITGPSMIARGIPWIGTFRLYLINPNDFAIRFEYHSDYGKPAATLVAANSIAVIDLDSKFLGPLVGAEHPTGSAFPIYINAEFPYLAAAVIKSRAVSPDVRIARPLTKPR